MTDPLERLSTALQNAGCRPKRVRDGVWVPGQGNTNV